ncbi:hypothetical protein [Tsukamurella sputi]|uniref:hypothetical protein n=1 Tax=Tsukamurella sputi TaxID=2591848 RepID=UPI001315952D|nr:hypothetical protein [Tsukamurella sputi]
MPGQPEHYYLAGTVEALPATASSMYAVYEVGDRMCVYRDGQWWCSPTDVVREVLPL